MGNIICEDLRLELITESLDIAVSMNTYFYKLLFLSFLLSVPGIPQTKSNLELLYSLNDSLVNQICNEIRSDINEISLKLNLGETYSLFSNHIRNEFTKKGKTQPFEDSNLTEINIVMDKAGVLYGEIEKDGWFGSYFVPRSLYIEGNYLVTKSGAGLKNYYITSTDTIQVDQIQSLENESFPFTKGEIPPEPFLDSIIEPVIAIGVAAISIFLFFSQRSK